MRFIHNKERVQRGCTYCTDAVIVSRKKGDYRNRKCPYDECPYHELDGFETYGDYLKSTGSTSLTVLFKELGLGQL